MKKIPLRYLPKSLSKRDKKKQINALKKSKKMYKSHKYYQRPKVGSFFSKTSKHVRNAQKIYGIDKITPGEELAKKSGCSVSALRKIVNKGEGAYYSSGSRPNQTARSWGLARLASALTGGKSAAVDYNIIENGCKHTGKAYRMANMAKKKYGYGHGKTKKVIIKGGAIIKKEFEDGIYEGQFEDGKRHGIGQMDYNDGSKYKGYWKNDKKHGEGLFLFTNKDVYRGYWENDKKHGKGAIKYYNNDEGYTYFSGNWKDDMKNGEGFFVDKYNKEYKVNYKNDEQIGEKIYKNYIPEISNKPLTIKSAPVSIQLDGNCFAHAIARNITRLFLVLTLIDGEKSEEMFIALFCFILLQNSKKYDNPNKNSYCKPNYTVYEYQKEFYNPLLTEINSIFTYKYKDIPCDIIVGGCRIDIKKDKPILTFTEEEKNTFISGFYKIIPYLTYEFIEYKYDVVKKNYPPKIIADLLKKKLQPCIIINGCKYEPNSNDNIIGLPPGEIIYYYDNDNNKKGGIIVKSNKNEKNKIISYDITPLTNLNGILSSSVITINNSNILTKINHAFIIRSWRKTRNDSEFCYKNTWFDSNNICIDDIRNICKSMVSKTHKLTDENVNITFICPNFDLDRIKENDIELYNKIKTRIDMIHDTTYNLENKKRKKIDGDSGEDKEEVEENENKSISKKVTNKRTNKKIDV